MTSTLVPRAGITRRPTRRPTRTPAAAAVAAVAVGASVLVAWWAIVGWDTATTIDPVTGREVGPYELWQAVALATTTAAIGAVAHAARVAAVTPLVVGSVLGFGTVAIGHGEPSLAVSAVGAVALAVVVAVVAGTARLVTDAAFLLARGRRADA